MAKGNNTATTEASGKKKAVCPVKAEQFLKDAKPITITLEGMAMSGLPRQFSSGSLGWNINAKVNIMVGDTLVPCQVGLNVTAVGSKG